MRFSSVEVGKCMTSEFVVRGIYASTNRDSKLRSHCWCECEYIAVFSVSSFCNWVCILFVSNGSDGRRHLPV